MIDYDASRLQEDDIAFTLRNAGIPLTNQVRPAA